MSLLSRSNAVFLLCFLFLLSVAIPHSSVPTQVIDQSMSSGLARQVVSIVSLGPIVKTTLGLSVAQPIIQGWGGVTLDEAANGQLQPTLSRLNQSGYNGVRIGFSGSVTHCPSGELGSWSPDWFNQTIHLAQQYGLWVILDYHSYADLVDSTCQAQWLLFWNSVLSVDWRYDRIVWEPINEPAGSVAVLSSAYQAWITLARGLGDKHWIAVENTISNDGCNFDPLSLVNCYPKVTDPLNQTFLSIHPYLFYDLWQSISSTYGVCSSSSANPWGNGTAECVANVYNQGMLQASGKYHMPILDTEGGAVYYSCNNVCARPPDAVGTDDASYSVTTFHFIQYLTTLMDSRGMGWLWWEAGEGSCCGALDTWGSLLSFQQTKPSPQENPPSLEAPTGQSVTAGSTLAFQVNATDPDLPLQNLTLSCNNCPYGASFPTVTGMGNVSGVFAWTPNDAQAGPHNVTFTVTDGAENSNATVSITVHASNTLSTHKPAILTIPGNQTVIVSDVLLFNVTATDPNNPTSQLILACLNCNVLGATFVTTGTSQSTGTFRWGPSSGRLAQTYTARFTVTDETNSTSGTVLIKVARTSPEIDAGVNPSNLTLGSSPVSALDTATLSRGFDPTGIVSFSVFEKPTCAGTAVFTGSTPVQNGNGVYLSPPFHPQTNGTYYWFVHYDGDPNNNPSSTPCGAPSQTLTVYSANPQQPSNPSPPFSIVLLMAGTGVALSASAVLALEFYKRKQSLKRHSTV